jgi:pimeloyl-ACP methyl ester carboxylesterase
VSWYVDGPPEARPVLLVHSINAAGSAFEVRPLYERLRGTRRVYAVDLPGFGFSGREPRPYLPRTMTDALHDVLDSIVAEHGPGPVDALALSLSSEFLGRAAVERPDAFRSLALVSPTGFARRGEREGPPGSNRGMPALYGALAWRGWRKGLFAALTRRGTIRYFLERTYGSKRIDEDLLEYDWLTTHQPGAEHAPLRFIGGFLFSADIGRVYRALAVPTWVSHGVRGDFVDYARLDEFKNAPGWRTTVFDTGALPHFERPEEFVRAYEAFLASPS